MEKQFLKENEKLEDLNLDGLKIIQNSLLYRFTSDAVILSNFVKAKPSDKLIDLGTGSAVIAILTAHKNNLQNVVGVELQKDLADMASRSVAYNKMQNKIQILNMDMKNILSYQTRKNLGLENFDIVVSNPPYKKGQTRKNLSESARLARHEIAIDMQTICKIASVLLKFSGKFFVIYDANRLAELMFCLKQNGLEPKKMLLTQPAENKQPTLVLIEAVKGGKEGLKILPNLTTNDKDGKYLQTLKYLKLN